MTTVIWDGAGKLVADTRASGHNGDIAETTKVKAYEDFALIAACGFSNALPAFEAWLKKGSGKYPKELIDATCIYIDAYGIRAYEGSKRYSEYKLDRPIAWGTGAMAALALLSTGMTPEGAVKATSAFDIYTGESIDVVEIKLDKNGG